MAVLTIQLIFLINTHIQCSSEWNIIQQGFRQKEKRIHPYLKKIPTMSMGTRRICIRRKGSDSVHNHEGCNRRCQTSRYQWTTRCPISWERMSTGSKISAAQTEDRAGLKAYKLLWPMLAFSTTSHISINTKPTLSPRIINFSRLQWLCHLQVHSSWMYQTSMMKLKI